MTRVLICTPTYYLQGGVERIIESLAADLPARGIEVLFALAKGARFHDPAKFRAAFPSIRGVDVDGTSGTVYGRHRALRRVIVEQNPDVVLIARMFDAYPVVSQLKLEGHRTRLAVTIQAYESDYFADVERYQDFVDLCVASGERIAAEVRRRTSVPTVSIPGGVAPPRRLRVARDGPLRIGYVGRIEQIQKRALDLPLLVEQLNIPFTLDIAGDGTVLEGHRARGCRLEAREDLQQCRLAASRWPDDAEKLAPLEVEVDRTQRVDRLMAGHRWIDARHASEAGMDDVVRLRHFFCTPAGRNERSIIALRSGSFWINPT